MVLLIYLEIGVGQRMSNNFFAFSREMIIIVPCIFIIIGLIDVWIPTEWIQHHIGKDSGVMGGIYVILLAIFQGGPIYCAFPVAHLLWKKGTSMRNVFLYLSAFSSLKVPMLIFEVSFLGWKFAMVRAIVALPIFVLIALAMAAYSRKTGIELNEIGAS
jgi:uncharacterized membrane protein YraQ (UPF0718 family)